MAEAAKPISCEGFKTGCHAVLRGNMFHDVSRVVLRGRRKTFATFSEDALHVSWQAQHFGDLPCHFDKRSTLDFRRVVLRIHSTLHTFHFTLHTLHSTLYTLHFSLHTLHFTLLTPHFTLHTPHSYTLHFAVYTLYTLHT